ncbi:MAG TPA: DUF4112 domain-containing protein [Vicinamibacterales bacterium]|jgi:Domain of unknown function (DUF4112)|nr:DUF4112 domain-containing protein [Vicinamibacterales bacterium]
MKSPVTRLRRLTPGQEQRLELLRRVARMLDSALRVPGTTFRFGLDPILGLIPGVGDLVSPLFTLGMLFQARDLGVPRVVQLRMIFNVAIDVLTGFVPLIGDLFDFAWKANNRNLALLERHAYEEHKPSAGDWAFVAVCVALLVVIAAVPFLLLGWAIDLIAGLFR